MGSKASVDPLSSIVLALGWVSREIWDFVCFVFCCSGIGLKDWQRPLGQSDARPKSTWLAFSRASTLSSYWLYGVDLSFDWPLWSRRIWFHNTQSKCTLLYEEKSVQNVVIKHCIKMFILINKYFNRYFRSRLKIIRKLRLIRAGTKFIYKTRSNSSDVIKFCISQTEKTTGDRKSVV